MCRSADRKETCSIKPTLRLNWSALAMVIVRKWRISLRTVYRQSETNNADNVIPDRRIHTFRYDYLFLSKEIRHKTMCCHKRVINSLYLQDPFSLWLVHRYLLAHYPRRRPSLLPCQWRLRPFPWSYLRHLLPFA